MDGTSTYRSPQKPQKRETHGLSGAFPDQKTYQAFCRGMKSTVGITEAQCGDKNRNFDHDLLATCAMASQCFPAMTLNYPFGRFGREQKERSAIRRIITGRCLRLTRL